MENVLRFLNKNTRRIYTNTSLMDESIKNVEKLLSNVRWGFVTLNVKQSLHYGTYIFYVFTEKFENIIISKVC